MTGGGGRGGLKRLTETLEARLFAFAFEGGGAPARMGLCRDNADTEPAGEEYRESGEDIWPSIRADDNTEDSRNLEGIFEWELVWDIGRSWIRVRAYQHLRNWDTNRW